jgi:chromosome segregation ATPase
VIELATAHESTAEKLAQMTAAVAEREAAIKDLEQSHAALHDHNQQLSFQTASRDSAYGSAEDKIKEQADLIALLEGQIKAMRSANEMQIEQMNAQLQREQLERSMAEGALESGRKDIARLLREIGSLQHRPNLAGDLPAPGLRSAA